MDRNGAYPHTTQRSTHITRLDAIGIYARAAHTAAALRAFDLIKRAAERARKEVDQHTACLRPFGHDVKASVSENPRRRRAHAIIA